MLLDYFRFFNSDIFHRHILMPAPGSRFHFLDPVHHILAFHYLAKHTIAETLGSRGLVIKKTIVLDIDKKLRQWRNARRRCVPWQRYIYRS